MWTPHGPLKHFLGISHLVLNDFSKITRICESIFEFLTFSQKTHYELLRNCVISEKKLISLFSCFDIFELLYLRFRYKSMVLFFFVFYLFLYLYIFLVNCNLILLQSQQLFVIKPSPWMRYKFHFELKVLKLL